MKQEEKAGSVTQLLGTCLECVQSRGGRRVGDGEGKEERGAGGESNGALLQGSFPTSRVGVETSGVSC